MNLKWIVILIIIMVYMPPSSADAADIAYQSGVGMISDGMEHAAANAGNDLNGGNSTNFTQLAIPYNPLENPAVITIIGILSGITFLLFLSFLAFGLVYIFFISNNSRLYRSLNYMFNEGKEFDFMWYASALGRILVMTIFIYVIMVAILLAAWIATTIMGDGALRAIQSSNASGWLSFIYDVLMWIVGIFTNMRNMILSILFGIAEVWVILREYPILKPAMNKLGIYYIVVVFMQPIMILVATLGIATDMWINNTEGFQNPFGGDAILTPTGFVMSSATEVALILLIMYTGYKLLKGVDFVNRGMK